jgi:hypothetical protein
VTFRAVGANLADPYQTPADYQHKLPDPDERVEAEVTKVAKATKVDEGTVTHVAPQKPAASAVGKPAGANAATPGFIGNPGHAAGSHYAGDLFSEVQRYAALAAR